VGLATGARLWLGWVGVAALAAPVGIVLHELGHFGAAEAFGFPEVTLHFASVSDQADGAGFPAWQYGVKALAGPAVTLFLVLGFTIAARRFGPGPFTAAPVFAAGVRTVILGAAYFFVRITNPEGAATSNIDEVNAVRHLGLSIDLFMGFSMFLILGTWIYLAWLIPKPVRWKAVVATILGMIVGIGAWISVIGPAMLP
jgi:hypothetical protein